MNLPNKLTLLRVCLIPVFLILYPYAVLGEPLSRYSALVVFVIASLTDALDGHIARSRGLVTNFGKLMDPLADKLLVAAAMIAMVQTAELPAWVAILIISREFLITGFRMIALEKNMVIAASKWGKLKTISQIIMIVIILLNILPYQIEYGIILIATALTVISAADYVMKNLRLIKDM
ncbi:MAG: CDP-diacylglycerol--glycerol-3-phosphate 3-phosphatidyltransferase [Clostridiales bacterium]|jgi:CDP-diacylglycerol--glycerol-3-phosphate 3-phosphatidyltransferase|nr:CDP-diacylglycerol--glycerol-3-phosphate 3-phosphatidyltransferase [Clostridiales bacterium]